MSIAPATPADLRAVADVHVASWRAAYRELLPADYLASLSVERREAAWRQVLGEGRSQLLVARTAADSIGGFVSFGPSRDADAPPGRGEVWALYVHPDHWATGLGRSLWSAAVARRREQGDASVGLWVIMGNERAIRFYAAVGCSIDAGSEKDFELGGRTLREVRLVCDIGRRPLASPPGAVLG